MNRDMSRSHYQSLLDSLERELVEVAKTCNDADGDVPMSKWRPRHHSVEYGYRTIYSNETVLDIGDEGEGYETWQEVVDASIAIWGRLTRAGYKQGRDWWPAISGGKGTHTHIFIQNDTYRSYLRAGDFDGARDHDNREPFIDFITRGQDAQRSIPYDKRKVAPHPGTSQIREFGAKHPKTGIRKALWTGPYDALPNDKEKLLQGQHLSLFPREVGTCGTPCGALHAEIRRTFGGNCPRSRACWSSPGWLCDNCPAVR